MEETRKGRNEETLSGVLDDMRARAEVAEGMDPDATVHHSAVAGMLKEFADRFEAAACRMLLDANNAVEAEKERTAEVRGLLDRALGFVEERLADVQHEYKGWEGRESAGHARGLKADIDECEAILREARGEKGEGGGGGGADGAAPAKPGREGVTDCHGLGGAE